MAQTQSNAKTNTRTNVRITRDQWFAQVLNNDGGAALIEKLGFEPQNRKKQGDDLSISFICKNGTYIFTKWNESDASGNAIKFFQFVNNLSDWKQTVWAISELLGIESYIKTNGNNTVFIPKTRIVNKKEKKQEQKPAPKNYKDLEFREYSQEDYDHFAEKHSCKDLEKIKEIIRETRILAVKDKKFVYAIETIEGIKEYRIIQPFYAKGRDFKVFGNSKRVFYPSLEKTKKAEPNYQFSMGMDSPKDLSKAIILPSGESDFLTLRIHGYQAVCLGGEGQKFNEYSLEIMRKNGYSPKNLSILFDNDSNKAGFKPEKDKNTGLEFAKKLSLVYKIPYLTIPNFKNSDIKDVSDFFAIKGEDNKQWFEKYILNLPNFETNKNKNENKYKLRELYLGQSLFAKNKIIESILKYKITELCAGAGDGKSRFIFDQLIADQRINENFDFVFLFTPTVILAKDLSQNNKKYPLLIGGEELLSNDNDQVIIGSFDKLFRFLQEKLAKNPQAKILSIYDEIQNICSESAYRPIMNDILHFFSEKNNCKFLNMSATYIEELSKYLQFETKQTYNFLQFDLPNKTEITLNVLEYEDSATAKNFVFNETKEIIAKGNTPIILRNSKEENLAFQTELAKENIKTDVLSAGVRKGFTAEIEKLFTSEGLNIGVHGLIGTNILAQGVSIKNDNCEGICVTHAQKRIDDTTLTQFLYRARKTKNFNCSILLPKKFVAKDYTSEMNKIDTRISQAQDFIRKNNDKEDVFRIDQDSFAKIATKNPYFKQYIVFDTKTDRYILNWASILNLRHEARINSLNNKEFIEYCISKVKNVKINIFEQLEKVELLPSLKNTENSLKEAQKEDYDSFVELIKEDDGKTFFKSLNEIDLADGQSLRKKINYFLKTKITDNIETIFIDNAKLGTAVEVAKKFFAVQFLGNDLEINQICELLLSANTTQKYNTLLKRLTVERYAKDGAGGDALNEKELNNYKLFQKTVVELFNSPCEHTKLLYADKIAKSKGKYKENHVAKSILWNKKDFFLSLREELMKKNFFLQEFKSIQLIKTYFDIMFSFEIEKVDDKEISKHKLHLITNLVALQTFS